MSPEIRRLVEASQTPGVAYLAGLRPHTVCQRGGRLGPVKVEPCGPGHELDLESILWARGAAFPRWKLSQRLKCPRGGHRVVDVLWVPGASNAIRRARDLVTCKDAAAGIKR